MRLRRAEAPRARAGLDGPLSPAEFARFSRLARWLPTRWTRTARRRRFLLLGAAAPGFAAVATTPLHQHLAVLSAGAALFAAALGFRRASEALFARAEAAALWPPSPNPIPETRRHG